MKKLKDENIASYYAHQIKDDSMTPKGSGKISFLEGDIIIIDSLKKPKHGSYVLIKQSDSAEPFLRQYLVQGNTVILSSINELYPSIQYHEDSIEICGVAITKEIPIN